MRIRNILFFAVLVSTAACSQNRNSNDVKFSDQKAAVAYEQYIQLKDALVASNPEEAQKAAAKLKTTLMTMPSAKSAGDDAAKISGTNSIEDQRDAFGSLSTKMADLLRGGSMVQGKLYLDYCPMADAVWLSNSEEIRNPYFGEKMMTCGSVRETIE